MKALTLTQPFCGLVASGIKLIENRPRRIISPKDFGKRFALHASRVIDERVYDRIEEIDPKLKLLPSFLVGGMASVTVPAPTWYRLSRITSAVIGVATLVGVAAPWEVESDQQKWAFGPVCYVLRDVIALGKPVPCRGWQSFWTMLPADAEAVERQLAEGA